MGISETQEVYGGASKGKSEGREGAGKWKDPFIYTQPNVKLAAFEILLK